MLAVLLLLLVALCTCACSSSPKRPPPRPEGPKALSLVHHVGGTHYRTLVHKQLWYQTFGHSLLVLPPGEVTPLKSLELGKPGATGPAVDLALDASGQRLFVVIEDDEVIELSLEQPQSPTIVQRHSSETLGIQPRRISRIGTEILICGRGGIVYLNDRKRLLTVDDDVTGIAQSENGRVACVRGQIVRLENQRFVGSATNLQMLDDDLTSDARLVFTRQGTDGGLVGLMSGDVRELDPQRATVGVAGIVHSVRRIADRLWIVTDRTVAGYKIEESKLSDPIYIDVAGAFDIARLDSDRLAIAGSFGRLVYSLKSAPSAADPDNTQRFVRVHREPSRLSRAMTDGRYILAGSSEGLWMYLINARAELTKRQFDREPPVPPTTASTSAWRAVISEDRRSMTLTANDGALPPVKFVELRDATLHCVAEVDGDFWIGHERGITVLAPPTVIQQSQSKSSKPASTSSSEQSVRGRLRIDGPVLYIYPLLVGGGASFVSEFGGFGVAKFVEVQPSATR